MKNCLIRVAFTVAFSAGSYVFLVAASGSTFASIDWFFIPAAIINGFLGYTLACALTSIQPGDRY